MQLESFKVTCCGELIQLPAKLFESDWETLSDAELVAAMEQELAAGDMASWHKVIREQRATFACRPGIARPGASTAHPRVVLAGDYTWATYPATLEGAVRSGLRAANSLI